MKSITRLKHKKSTRNTQQTNGKIELPTVQRPSAQQAYNRMQRSEVLGPDDLIALQLASGNGAVTSIATQHRYAKARTPHIQPMSQHAFINNPRIQREDGQAANLFVERNYARITNEQQQQIDTFASRAQTLIGPWGELRQSVSGTGQGMSHSDYLNRLRQIKSQLHNAYNQFTRDFGETVINASQHKGQLQVSSCRHHTATRYRSTAITWHELN